MPEHLGYDEQAAAGCDGGNSRIGSRSKTVITKLGPIEMMCHMIVMRRSADDGS